MLVPLLLLVLVVEEDEEGEGEGWSSSGVRGFMKRRTRSRMGDRTHCCRWASRTVASSLSLGGGRGEGGTKGSAKAAAAACCWGILTSCWAWRGCDDVMLAKVGGELMKTRPHAWELQSGSLSSWECGERV